MGLIKYITFYMFSSKFLFNVTTTFLGLTFVGVTFPIGLVFGPIIQVYHPRKPFLTLLRDNRELSVTVPSKSYLDNVWVISFIKCIKLNMHLSFKVV